jgi:Nucleotidyl transferase AbiEii toxin, Type IV TA system
MHREVLTKRGAELFGHLGRFDDFYLAGGTGLALQLGHRISVDFDLFIDSTIKRSLLPKVQTVFGPSRSISPLVNNPEELTVLVDGVKMTFLSYPFPTFETLVRLDEVFVLSIREIAATKAYTIGRRGSFKDYVDLYFVLAGGHASLKEVIDLAEQKFDDAFNSRLFLEQIVSVDDLEDTEIEFLAQPLDQEEVRTFFEEQVKEYIAAT